MAKTRSMQPWVCESQDNSCVRPIEPIFQPGMSVRRLPSCSTNICDLSQLGGGNLRVTNQGTLDRSEWIKGWCFKQLETRGLVDCAEHPLGQRSGGWWADAFRTRGSNPRFRSGSKLWALQFAHGGAANQVLLQAKQYAQAALAPLVSWGIASKVAIDVLFVSMRPAVILLKVTVSGPGLAASFSLEGQQQPSAEWLWREHAPATANRAGRLYARVAV